MVRNDFLNLNVGALSGAMSAAYLLWKEARETETFENGV